MPIQCLGCCNLMELVGINGSFDLLHNVYWCQRCGSIQGFHGAQREPEYVQTMRSLPLPADWAEPTEDGP